MQKRIEVEKGELALRNNVGDLAIIPANKREDVLRLLEDNDYDAIDKIVRRLPSMSDYAEDGTIYPNEDLDASVGLSDDIGGSPSSLSFDDLVSVNMSSDVKLPKDINIVPDKPLKFFPYFNTKRESIGSPDIKRI